MKDGNQTMKDEKRRMKSHLSGFPLVSRLRFVFPPMPFTRPDFRHFRRIGALLLAAFALAMTAARAQGPAAAAGPAITAGVQETVLPNGLRVLTKEVRHAPVVNFAVWYRVGSRNEHTGITGCSHLLEHMLFKGTQRYRPGEISRVLAANGSTFNAGTYYDTTRYWETLASDRLELAIQIEADRMVNSRIDAAQLASEMSVVRSELEGGENDPGELLNRAVAAAAFESHPYQWPIIGWRADVENVTREELYRYYRRYYGPNNATVVMVGDFDTPQALALVRKHFGALPRIPTPAAVYTQEPPQRGERRVVVRRAGALPMVEIAYRVPAGKHPDFYALDLLANAVGSGRSSRLYQALVEKELATTVTAGAPTMHDPYLFFFTATARPGVSAERLEAALRTEIEAMRRDLVPEATLQAARNRMEADFLFQTNSVSDQGEQIGYYDVLMGWRYLNTYLDRVRRLTSSDLQKVAARYFVPDASTVGHFVPSSQAAPGGPPPREASARVELARRGERPIPLPRPSPAPRTRQTVVRFRLANGIRVVVQENRANPTLALVASLPAGAVLDPAGKEGTAALTAEMLSRGSDKRTSREFAARLEALGAQLSADADELAVQVAGRALSRDAGTLVDALGELLRRPAFPAADFSRLRGQTLAGLDEEKEDPSALAGRAFSRTVYPEGHPLRPRTLDEERAAIQGLTQEDLVRFYREQYGPDQMILVLVGDLSVAKARMLVEQALGDWARNPRSRPLPKLDLPLQAQPRREVIRVADKSEAALLWGHAGLLKRSDPDFYATQILNMILGGGGALNSRLGTVIRDEQGLAYDVSSFYDSGLYPGPFQIALGTNPVNAGKAARSLEAELRGVQQKGVTQREVEEAVAYLTGRFPLRLETNSGLAFLLWQMEYYSLGADYLDQYGRYYRSVTTAQVNAAAQKHLFPQKATLIQAGTLP